jgi:hypothetical protein
MSAAHRRRRAISQEDVTSMDTDLTKIVLFYYVGFGIVATAYGLILRYFVNEYYHSPSTAGPGSAAFFVLGFVIVTLQLIERVSKSRGVRKEASQTLEIAQAPDIHLENAP